MFSISRPPTSRLSSTMTAFIWSNSSSDGTPPKYRNADSRPSITTAIVWRS